MANTKLAIFCIMFILLTTQIGALMGESIFSNTPNAPTPPSEPDNWLGYITWPFENIIYFFQLMGISSAYTFLGTINIILILVIIMWVIELVRGV